MNYFYLYKITNIITNEIYIGVHQTKNLDDGYMGSGKLLLKKYLEYGKENFKKEILEFFENSNEMFLREEEIVNSQFILREDTYNLIRGGNGLNSDRAKSIGQLSHVKKIRAKTMREIDQKLWENPDHREKISNSFKKLWKNPEFRKKNKERIIRFNKKNWENPEFRKKQSDDRMNTIFIINNKTRRKKRIFIENLSEYSFKLWSLSKAATKKIKKILLITLFIIHSKP